MWNYRLIDIDGLIGLHEVYYNVKGRIELYSETPEQVAWAGYTTEDIKQSLLMYLEACGKPVLLEENLPGFDKKNTEPSKKSCGTGNCGNCVCPDKKGQSTGSKFKE